MNRTRMLVLAVLSLVLSVGVAFVAYRMLESRANPTARLGRIVVATKKLPIGTRLTAADVTAVAWPTDAPVEGGHADAAEVVGRAVIVGVVPNEPLLESKLASVEAGAGLTAAIPEGMRAVAVKVNEVVGVAGFVLPGTRVDVILTGSPTERGGTDTAKVILENVQVLSAGRQTETDGRGTPQDVTVVTLLVTPVDAQRLALATTDGRIQLALRNPTDLERTDPASVSRERLFSQPAQGTPAPAAAAARVRRAPAPRPTPTPQVSVELIQGGKKETVVFNADQDGPQ